MRTHTHPNIHHNLACLQCHMVIYLSCVLQNPFRFRVVSVLAEIQRQKEKACFTSTERRKIKKYSQVFVILIDIIQLQNVRVLY